MEREDSHGVLVSCQRKEQCDDRTRSRTPDLMIFFYEGLYFLELDHLAFVGKAGLSLS